MSLLTIMKTTKKRKTYKRKTYKRKTKTKKTKTKKRQMRGGNFFIKKNPRFLLNDNYISSTNTSFNENPYVRESHNCYMYFLNKKNKDVVKMCKKDYHKHKLCKRAQPGYASGYPLLNKKDYKCPKIMERTLVDNPNIYKIGENKKCIPSHYKGALVVAPNRDYHYYRENDDGKWTHKPGYKPSTNYDSKNNFIFNPRKASRDYGGTLNYKDFCGYLCVPRDEKKKRMAYWDSSKKTQKKYKKNIKK